jgi:hypothetical protein
MYIRAYPDFFIFYIFILYKQNQKQTKMSNSKAARRVRFGGVTPSASIISVARAGGGVKKGGAPPSSTGFMRDFTQRASVSTPAKNKDLIFRFTQYYNVARRSTPM